MPDFVNESHHYWQTSYKEDLLWLQSSVYCVDGILHFNFQVVMKIVKIGRDAKNDVVICDAKVSHHHCQFVMNAVVVCPFCHRPLPVCICGKNI